MQVKCDSCGAKGILIDLDNGQHLCAMCYEGVTSRKERTAARKRLAEPGSIHPTIGEYITSTILGLVMTICALSALPAASSDIRSGWDAFTCALIAGGILALINTRIDVRRHRETTRLTILDLEQAVRDRGIERV